VFKTKVKLMAVVIIAVHFLLAACIPIGRPPEKYQFEFSRVYKNDKSALHNAVLKALQERGFEIISDSGVPGKIETNWLDIDRAYYYGTFQRRGIKDYCDCGRPDLNWTYDRIKTKVAILANERQDGMALVVSANYATYASYTPCISLAIRDPDEEGMGFLKKCESTGELEKELFTNIQNNLSNGGTKK